MLFQFFFFGVGCGFIDSMACASHAYFSMDFLNLFTNLFDADKSFRQCNGSMWSINVTIGDGGNKEGLA